MLLAGLAVLGGIVLLFSGAQRELAPEEDQGVIFVQFKAPQYANMAYTQHYADEMDRFFQQQPEYSGSWFGGGCGGR